MRQPGRRRSESCRSSSCRCRSAARRGGGARHRRGCRDQLAAATASGSSTRRRPVRRTSPTAYRPRSQHAETRPRRRRARRPRPRAWCGTSATAPRSSSPRARGLRRWVRCQRSCDVDKQHQQSLGARCNLEGPVSAPDAPSGPRRRAALVLTPPMSQPRMLRHGVAGHGGRSVAGIRRLKIIGVIDLLAAARCMRKADAGTVTDRWVRADYRSMATRALLARCTLTGLASTSCTSPTWTRLPAVPKTMPLSRWLAETGAAIVAGRRRRDGRAGPTCPRRGATRVVLGLETLTSFDALREIVAATSPDSIAFSLDLRDGHPITSEDHCVACRSTSSLPERRTQVPESVIVLDLARVVPVAASISRRSKPVKHAIPDVTLLAGGGLRGARRPARSGGGRLRWGADGALVANLVRFAAVTASKAGQKPGPT